jgi:hypothetical protein
MAESASDIDSQRASRMLHEWQSQPATSTAGLLLTVHFHFNNLTLENKMISRKKTFGGISVGEIHRILCNGEILKVEIIAFADIKPSSRGIVEKPLMSVRVLGEHHNRCYNFRQVQWLDIIPKDSPFWNGEEWQSYQRKMSCDAHFGHYTVAGKAIGFAHA